MYHGYRCTRKLCTVSAVILCDNNYHGIPIGDPVRYTRGNDTDEGCAAVDAFGSHFSSPSVIVSAFARWLTEKLRSHEGWFYVMQVDGGALSCFHVCYAHYAIGCGRGRRARVHVWVCVCGCAGAGVLAAWKIGVWVQGGDEAPDTRAHRYSRRRRRRLRRCKANLSDSSDSRARVRACEYTCQTDWQHPFPLLRRSTRTRRTIRIFPRHRIRLYILYFSFFYLI